MAISYPTTWPPTDVTVIALMQTAVEQAHTQAVLEKQHFVQGRRRLTLLNLAFPKVAPQSGASANTRGFYTSSVVGGTAFLHTPEASDFETPDDFSANVSVKVRARMKVIDPAGAPVAPAGATGTVRARILHGGAGTNIDIGYAHDAAGAATLTWRSASASIPKLTACGLLLYLFTSSADVEVECTHLYVYVEEQTTVG